MEAITVHYKLSEQEYMDAARLMFFPQVSGVEAARGCGLRPVPVRIPLISHGRGL